MHSYYYKGWNNNQPRPRRETESEYFQRIAREASREKRSARRGFFRGGPERTPQARASRPHDEQPERR
jgi:hypothetical protein